MATIYDRQGLNSYKRDHTNPFLSTGIGILGDHQIYRRDPTSSRLLMQPIAPQAPLPRAGMKIERQEYLSIEGMPIVFSEISGREQVLVFVPQKGSREGIRTRKGSPTFYEHTPEMKGLCKVLYVDTTDPEGKLKTGYVKADAFVRPRIQEIGENANSEKSMNYSFANSVLYFAGDVPGQVASVASTANMALSNDSGLTAWRAPSGTGMLTGAVNYLRAGHEMERAEKINDVAGKQFALLRYIRSGFEFTGGAIAACGRALSLIPGAAKVGAVALSVLSYAGNTAGLANIAFLCLPMIMKSIESWKWKRDLHASMDTGVTEKTKAANGLQFLIDKIELSKTDKEDVWNELTGKPLYALVHEEVVLNQEEEEVLHQKDKEEIASHIEAFMSQTKREQYPLISDWEQVRQNLSVRFMKEWAHRKLTREAEYGRTIGGGTLSLLKKEIRGEGEFLAHRLHYDSHALAQVQKLLETVEKDANWNIYCTAFMVIGCLLGVAGMVTAAVFSAGTAPFIIGVALSFVSNIMGTLGDFYWLKDDIQGLSDSSYKERMMIVLYSILTVAGAVLGGVFAQDAMTLAIILVGSAIMLSLNIYAYQHSVKKEKEAEELRVKKAEQQKQNEELARMREQERERLLACSYALPAF